MPKANAAVGVRGAGTMTHERLERPDGSRGREHAETRSAEQRAEGGKQRAVAEGRVSAEPVRVPEPLPLPEDGDAQHLGGIVLTPPSDGRHDQADRRGSEREAPSAHDAKNGRRSVEFALQHAIHVTHMQRPLECTLEGTQRRLNAR